MKYVLILILIFVSFLSYAQFENCSNGIDDDADGLTDCLDHDCAFSQYCNIENSDGSNNYIYSESACTYSPTINSLDTEPLWDSNITTSATLGMPVVGDIDQDGEVEIVSANDLTGYLYVLNGKSGTIERQIQVSNNLSAYPAIADVDGDGFAEVFIFDKSGNLFAFRHDLTTYWSSTQPVPSGKSHKINLADFDQDGNPELYYMNEILDATTGKVLISGTHGVVADRNWDTDVNALPVATDIFPDDYCSNCSGLELVMGHIIYSVNLFSGELKEVADMNSATSKTIVNATPTFSYQVNDLYKPKSNQFGTNPNASTTAVADVNSDGKLDIVLTGTLNDHINGPSMLFLWDVFNDKVDARLITLPYAAIPIILEHKYKDLTGNTCDAADGSCTWKRGIGMPSIANVDQDAELEIIFNSGIALFALNHDLTEAWINSNDYWDSGSGYTGLTTFDLNADGISEILYRDEVNLYIIDGSTGLPHNQSSSTFCSSQTQSEYPIVADVNGDGSAEIILSCGESENFFGQPPSTSSSRDRGFIRAYKANQGSWNSSRRLWNQFAYFNTNINDNLSIPVVQKAHYLSLSTSCLSSIPLNTFNAQTPLITACGDPVFPAAKLDFSHQGVTVTPPVCGENQVSLRIEFTNTGNKVVTEAIPISFYSSNPEASYANTDASPFLETSYLMLPDEGLGVGETLDTLITVNHILGISELHVSLNDRGQVDALGNPLTNEEFYPLNHLNSNIAECDTSPTLLSTPVDPLPFTVQAQLLRHNNNCGVGANNGEIQVLDSVGGTLSSIDYTFEWTNLANGQFMGNTSLLTGLDSGKYQVVVTNTAMGCSSLADTVTLQRLEEWPLDKNVTFNIIKNPSSCQPGIADGEAHVLINGIIADENQYEIIWEDEQQPGILAVGNHVTNLMPILYKVTVTDKITHCSYSSVIDMSLTQPDTGPPIITANSNCASPNGSLTAKLNAGLSSDYNYLLIQHSPFKDTLSTNNNGSFTGLSDGEYELRVYDPATECGKYNSGIMVDVPLVTSDPEIALSVANEQTACQAPYTGQLMANVSNPERYDWTWYRGSITSGPGALVVANAALTPDTLSTHITDLYTVIARDKSNGCESTATIQLTENLPSPDFSYPSSLYCQNDINAFPSINTPGGIFSSQLGLLINPTTGEIEVTASLPGIYTITYTLATCSSTSSNFTLEIRFNDDATFAYDTTSFCQNDVNPAPIIRGDVGGIFTSLPGLVFADTTTGEVDLSASVPGMYTITYTTPGICPDTHSFDIVIHEIPEVSGLRFSELGKDGFTMLWDDNPLISNYTIEVSVNANFSTLEASYQTSSNEYVVSNLLPGTTYFARVYAADECGGSSPSSSKVTTQVEPSFTLSKKEICINESVTISANGRHASESYSWRIIDALGTDLSLTDSIRTSTNFSYNFSEAGRFRVQLTLSLPQAVDTILEETIRVTPFPEVMLPSSASLINDSLSLTAVDATQYDLSAMTFHWHYEGQKVGDENKIWIKQPGTYQLEVVNATGCQTGKEIVIADERPLSQTISFDAIPDQTYGNPSFKLSATSTSGLAVNYKLLGGGNVVMLKGDSVFFTGTGEVSLQALQAGNADYLAAEPVTHSFTVVKAFQTINFPEVRDYLLEEGSFTLEAVSSSGLPLTFTSDGPVNVVGKHVSLLDTGTVTITASQTGTNLYKAAENVSQTFLITTPIAPVPLDTLHQLSIQVNAVTESEVKYLLYQKKQGETTLLNQQSSTSLQHSFDQLPEGEYTVKLALEDPIYLDTYNGDKLTLYDAQWISVKQDTEIRIQAIQKPKMTSAGVNVSGVFMHSDQAANGRIMMFEKLGEVGIPVVGLAVYLIDAHSGSLSQVATTDDDGRFFFQQVEAESYFIQADYKNLPVDPESIFEVSDKPLDLVIMAGEDIHLVSALEVEDLVTDIDDQIEETIKLYPNPVGDLLYLEFSDTFIKGEIKLFDLQGSCVYGKKLETAKSEHTLSHLSSSYYQLQIIIDGKSRWFKVLKK